MSSEQKKKGTNYGLVALEVLAIAACYLLVAWPLASATTVNVIFNGQTQATAELSMDNLLNKQISSKHDPSDVTWTNVKILATISSASLSHTIEKIYLYKCKNMNPSSCVMTEPQVFDKWIDTEIAWKDASEREGLGTYPQVANMLIIIKLVGPNGRTSWVGSWDVVKRTDYNVFNTYSHDISSLDFYAKSADLVLPAKSFIQGLQMIPFNWADKVVLRGASSLYGIGGSDADLSSSPPQLQSAQPSSNEITTINKDFYFVLSETSSGISVPATLNLNPSFNCGDNICEIDLGETSDTCCYDCGCAEGEYCDAAPEVLTGSCKNAAAIAVQATPISAPTITDCSVPFTASVKAQVNSPPSSLSETATAYITLGEDVYASTCTKSTGPEYVCPITMDPNIRCGTGSLQKSPNTINITLTFNDGPNVISRELSDSFPVLTVTYDCACQDGFYCDAGETRCKPEGSIGLQILNVTSYMTNYNPSGDSIIIYARITNPPTDLTTTGTANYVLGSLYKGNMLLVNGTSGNAECTGGAGTGHVYRCSIPLSITDYDHVSAYYVRGNTFSVSVSYSNGGTQVVRDLSAPFSDITIPSYRCGDGVLNNEETEETCCLDAGCSSAGQYCDAERGCSYINNVSLSIVSVQPKETEDCKRINTINITARVNNVPYQTNINYVHYYLNGEMQNWGLDCSTPNTITGLTYCQLQIPPIEGCELPFYTVGPNSLNMTMTFPDGLDQMITRELSTSFDDIQITPIWHCGQFGCETEFGESGENCCIDCGCADNEYCDYDMQYNPDGQCREKSDIRLVIDSPSAPLKFSSCEKSQKVEVLAHIENEPSGVALEGWYGKINGESTQMLVCKEASQRLRRTINKSYECRVNIPAVQDCSKGDVHEYTDNSLSFFISYTDGLGRRGTQTLTAAIPQITLSQGIRSIYDITQEVMGKLRGKVEDTMDAMNELLDIMEFCLKMMLVTTIALITMTMWVGFRPQDFKGIEGTDFGDRVGAMSQFSNFIITAMGKICQQLQAYYDLQTRIIEMEMQMIQMQYCLDIVQHEIDVGNCDGREASCFTRTTSCLSFSNIRSGMNDMNSFMRSLDSNTAQIWNAAEDWGEAWEDLENSGGPGGASMTPRCGTSDAVAECCSSSPREYYYSPTTGYSPCRFNDFIVKLTPLDNCDFPVMFYRSEKLGGDWIEASVGGREFKIDLSTLTATGYYKYGYLCFDEAKDYNSHKKALAEKGQKPAPPAANTNTINLGKDKDRDCSCDKADEGGLGATVASTTTGTGSSPAADSVTEAISYVQGITDPDFNIANRAGVLTPLDQAIPLINNGENEQAKIKLDQAISILVNNYDDLNNDADKDRAYNAVNALISAYQLIGQSPPSAGSGSPSNLPPSSPSGTTLV